jgi:Protein of unknown function (DUF1566)
MHFRLDSYSDRKLRQGYLNKNMNLLSKLSFGIFAVFYSCLILADVGHNTSINTPEVNKSISKINIINEQKGWRLPNIKELSSVFEREFKNSRFNSEAFPTNEGERRHSYWSSTACGSGAANTFAGAWVLSSEGNVYCDSFDMPLSILLVQDK